MFAVCGLDCDVCPILIATRTGDRKLKEETARTWSELYAEYTGNPALTAEDMVCSGCQSTEGVLFSGCVRCPTRACCWEKDPHTCAPCDAYEQREMINVFFQYPQAQTVLDSLRILFV